VWERLDGGTNGSAIVDGLVDRFAVDRATAEADYVEFIEHLRSIGAVTGPTPL
jgi:hypothetical protein